MDGTFTLTIVPELQQNGMILLQNSVYFVDFLVFPPILFVKESGSAGVIAESLVCPPLDNFSAHQAISCTLVLHIITFPKAMNKI